MKYAKLINDTLYLSEDFGAIEGSVVVINEGYLDLTTGDYYVSPGILIGIGGMRMSKQDRNFQMLFGSWTGESISESANVDIGDSSGITACTVAASTFGTKVAHLSGEYVFIFDGEEWLINGQSAGTIATAYGLTVTGNAAENDIIVVTYTAASGPWEAIGKDNDDLSKDLNPDTETGKNVLGETTFRHSGYEPEVDVDPYYIDPSRKMYKHLREIAIEEKYGEADTLGYIAEAYFTTKNSATRKMTGYCYVRQAHFIPQSVGGDTAAFAIPVNIYPVGAMVKKKIVYDMATNEATITDLA